MSSAGELAQQERGLLCDLLLDVGPDHPTLCQDWTTSDLAAHLVLRERRPLASPGIVFGGPLAAYTARVQQRLRVRRSYEALVERVRSGPPLHLRPVDGAMNLSELAIHHEDVRRAGATAAPRPAGEVAELEAALWKLQGRRTRFLTRKLDDVDLTLATPPEPATEGETRHIGGGSRPVTLRGRPLELVLYLSGRRAVADVELEGDEAAIEEVGTGPLGL